MAGHMGNERVTVKNLEVVEVRKEENLLLIRGAIPGCPGTMVLIKKSRGKK
jgi:large subunit ribosomal protein L3